MEESALFLENALRDGGFASLDALANAVGYSSRTLLRVKRGEIPLSRFMREAINKVVSNRAKFGSGIGSSTLMEDCAIYGSPRQKLKQARLKAGMTIAELAKAVGYAIGPLQALEDGGARISEKQAAAIARVLPGLSAEDLLEGDALRVFSDGGAHGIVGQKPNMTLVNVKARYVPLLSCAQAGRADVAALDEGYTGEAFIAFDVADPKAFALRIEGDSMTPFINQGDVVILSPGSDLRRGDEVVVQTIEGECFCKVWGGVVGGMVTLSSHNPQHHPFTIPRDHIAWVYPVIQTSKTRR